MYKKILILIILMVIGLVSLQVQLGSQTASFKKPLFYLTEDRTNSHLWPNVCVDKFGKVHVVWYEYVTATGEGFIYYRRLDKNGWSDAKKISGSLHYSKEPAIHCDFKGNVHICWIDATYGVFDIMYTEIKKDGTQSNILDLTADVGYNMVNPSIAAYDENNVSVVTYTRDSWQVFESRKVAGIWEPTWMISNGYARFAGEAPSITVGTDGVFHAAWPEATSGAFDIVYAYRDKGGDWEGKYVLYETSDADAQPEIRVDKYNRPHVVWMGAQDPHDYYWAIMYTYVDSNYNWQIPYLTTPSGLSFLPTIAVQNNGDVWIASTYGAWDNWFDSNYLYVPFGTQPKPGSVQGLGVGNPGHVTLYAGGPNDNTFVVVENQVLSGIKEIMFSSVKDMQFLPEIVPPANPAVYSKTMPIININLPNVINVLTWQINPENIQQAIKVDKVRIYRKENGQGDDKFVLISTTTNLVFSYVDKDITAKGSYVYALSSVDTDGNESEKIVFNTSGVLSPDQVLNQG